MSNEMKEMQKAKKDALKAKGKLKIALKRKHEELKKAQQLNNELRDTLEENVSVKTPPAENASLIQRESVVGRHGGGRRWPIWIVQLICELLVSGAAPSSTPDIILTTTPMNNQKFVKSLCLQSIL